MNPQDIYLTRLRDNGIQTEGFLTIWDSFSLKAFNTLELPWKENEHDISCIPPGVYDWVKVYSSKFKRDVILLTNVPGRTAIEIHNGNYNRDTHGCILVGNGFTDIDGDGQKDVTDSKNALKKMTSILPSTGKIFINKL